MNVTTNDVSHLGWLASWWVTQGKAHRADVRSWTVMLFDGNGAHKASVTHTPLGWTVGVPSAPMTQGQEELRYLNARLAAMAAVDKLSNKTLDPQPDP